MSNYVGRSTVGHERQSDGDEGNELCHHDPTRSRSAPELQTNTRRDAVVHPSSLAGHRKLAALVPWPVVRGSILSGDCLSLRRDERL